MVFCAITLDQRPVLALDVLSSKNAVENGQDKGFLANKIAPLVFPYLSGAT